MTSTNTTAFFKWFATYLSEDENKKTDHSNNFTRNQNDKPRLMRGTEMNIRKATAQDLSRIAEILVFVKRINYRPIFQDDPYSFGKLQVLSVAQTYAAPDILDHIWVYDDGIVKGMIHIEGTEIKELYVDCFFQNQGIGSELIAFAKNNYAVRSLWTIEKNEDAIRFYKRHGFHKTHVKKVQEGTTVYLILLERS